MITAASLLPSAAPVVTDIEIAHCDVTVTVALANGTELAYQLTLGDDGDVCGDAPNEILCEVERRVARYGWKYEVQS